MNDNVPCRHSIELRKFTMDYPADAEEPEQDPVEIEFARLIDHNAEAVVSAIGPDAFSIKEYREEWDKHIKDCADAIYDFDDSPQESCLRLGYLIMNRATKYLRDMAEENVRAAT